MLGAYTAKRDAISARSVNTANREILQNIQNSNDIATTNQQNMAHPSAQQWSSQLNGVYQNMQPNQSAQRHQQPPKINHQQYMVQQQQAYNYSIPMDIFNQLPENIRNQLSQQIGPIPQPQPQTMTQHRQRLLSEVVSNQHQTNNNNQSQTNGHVH